ncbi:hypothetical protein COLO4_07211 [Corchorus olitorius]|uniref:Uncharacterized protein n=1 Tax=Corchorus olitorius TaxID=93759 RepID=A0A1R3KKK3_9ROSI|nr:hypothetical protein COLO4_07211 [Corchorus olitorius]
MMARSGQASPRNKQSKPLPSFSSEPSDLQLLSLLASGLIRASSEMNFCVGGARESKGQFLLPADKPGLLMRYYEQREAAELAKNLV